MVFNKDTDGSSSVDAVEDNDNDKQKNSAAVGGCSVEDMSANSNDYCTLTEWDTRRPKQEERKGENHSSLSQPVTVRVCGYWLDADASSANIWTVRQWCWRLLNVVWGSHRCNLGFVSFAWPLWSDCCFCACLCVPAFPSTRDKDLGVKRVGTSDFQTGYWLCTVVTNGVREISDRIWIEQIPQFC